MVRRLPLIGSLLFIFVAGCGVDNQEKMMQETLVLWEKAGTYVNTIREELDKAIKDCGGNQNVFLKVDDKTKQVYAALQKAVDTAEDLRKIGKDLAETRQKIDLLKETLTAEQKAENRKRLGGKMNSTVQDLVKTKEDLQKSVNQFEALGDKAREALQPLRVKLREAEGQFESLVRAR